VATYFLELLRQLAKNPKDFTPANPLIEVLAGQPVEAGSDDQLVAGFRPGAGIAG